jgi:protein phosphatase 1 regulatory subunit 11
MNRTAHRPGHLSGRTDGSRTLTIHDVPTPEGGDDTGGVGQGGAGPSSIPDGVLRLRGAGNPSSRRVVWSDDTVDNEHMGKKSSKSE